MEQTYTEEKLIQFIYGECDLLERLEIEDAIENDFFTNDSYLSIMDAYNLLPKVKFSPSKKAVDNILQYSREICNTSC
jgi:hypothetical protein